MRIRRLLGVALLLALGIAGYAIFRLTRPYRGFSEPIFVDLPHGTSTASIGAALANAGVVESRWDFWLARLVERNRKPQAGEYRFEKAATPLEIFDRLARGDIFYYQLVVPEGKNMFDIGALAESLGVFSARDFVAAARNPALIRDLDPQAPTLEGYLFPSSYRLKRHATPEQLCRLMTAKFREVWHGLHARSAPHETVTLASLVEKEGKLAPERPVIAAVFENRLKIGMKLDCDPTTIYAALLDGRYNGVIHRSDLDSDNAYNTYRHKGLPPGPIANPGLPSLKAVLEPATSEALYFVLRPDGSGGHEFSQTIAAHQEATARYRRGLQR
ncbi:MAG TPA: endolytic transglycosylase MltG [Bryobacteraceae bacterium]|nr:endolytic transglycosylase MltG [Bryobacteraceae bacterium]